MRVKWQCNCDINEKDIAEMVRRIDMHLPIFNILDYYDFSVRWFKLSRFPIFTLDDIRRECCGLYWVERRDDYIQALG